MERRSQPCRTDQSYYQVQLKQLMLPHTQPQSHQEEKAEDTLWVDMGTTSGIRAKICSAYERHPAFTWLHDP